MAEYSCKGDKCRGMSSDIEEWIDHIDISFQDGENPYHHRLDDGLGPEPEIVQSYLAEWDERNANRESLMRALQESTGMTEDQIAKTIKDL